MERDCAERVRRLVSEAYRSGIECEAFLTRVWGAALDAAGCGQGTLWVGGLGCVYASGHGVGRVLEFTAERGGAADSVAPGMRPASVERLAEPAEHAHAGTRRLPLSYRGQRIGELAWSRPARADAAHEEFFARLATELAYVVKRYEVAARARDGLGQPLLLVGLSPELRQLERQIEKAAAVDFPVLVKGEFGCEKLHVAYAVHAGSDRRDGAFVEIRCGAQRPRAAGVDPGDWFQRAQGGSLFFSGIDELDRETQACLPEYVSSLLHQWRGANGAAERPRVMASATRDLREMVRRGDFSRALLAELDFLNLEVPALRRRRADLSPLVQYTFGKYCRRPTQSLSAESLSACTRYDWPENLLEVERTMARLAAMSESEEISLDTLHSMAPEIAGAAPAQAAGAGGGAALEAAGAPPPAALPAVEEVVRKTAAREYSFGARLHPCLRKALRHIGDNFDQPLSLGLLAQAACVSASHLSFLFRTNLGLTFKSFLGRLRVEKAKRLLVERADLKITDIALDVGFGDLSHFEKIFKRLTRVNPREYRRQGWEG